MRRSSGRLLITIPRAFSIEEAARELGYKDRSSVYDLIRAGELRAYPLGGGSLRVPADAIIEYLQSVVDKQEGGGWSEGTLRSGVARRRGSAPIGRGGRPARGDVDAA